MAITLPNDLEAEVAALTKTGEYGSVQDVVRDALRTLLAARPDLRESIACTLYAEGRFSLGGAAQWSGLDVERMKEALHRRGISRTAPESLEETAAMARRAIERIEGETG